MSKKLSYSLQKEMIVRHITEGKNNNNHDTSTPPAKRYRRSAVCVSPSVIEQSINLPAPASGTAYNKIEVVTIMSKIPDAGTRAATLTKQTTSLRCCNTDSNSTSSIASKTNVSVLTGVCFLLIPIGPFVGHAWYCVTM